MRSIVLTGFMGTGKTAVGRCLAAKLGREFIDLDAVLEARTGKTIREIFAVHGETYFRQLEAALCAEMGAREDVVIATGGGAFVNPHNRAAFAHAFTVCLDASPEEIMRRIGKTRHRPLLAGDVQQRIVHLLRERAPVYAQIACHVDTTGKAVEQVADEIMVLLETKATFYVTTPAGNYPIWVGKHILDRLGKVGMRDRCAIITQANIRALYAERVVQVLQSHQIEACVIEIPVGEAYKTLDTAREVYDQLIEAHLDRQTTIVALGGGVVGDLAGFVAATYLRGVPLVQIPTTLLAMVDASIGGKVAVDHPRGKNLIGAFKQPHAILADVALLESLPAAEWRAGMAEVIKHGVIGDPGLVTPLSLDEYQRTVEQWLPRAMRVKTQIVSRDPWEEGERTKLNLGHTFGHALELVSHYQLRHGEAVAMGLVGAARLAHRLHLGDADLVEQITAVLERLGLPTRVPCTMSAENILAAMQTDKKRRGSRLRFVLPRALGDVIVVDDVAHDDVRAVIEALRGDCSG